MSSLPLFYLTTITFIKPEKSYHLDYLWVVSVSMIILATLLNLFFFFFLAKLKVKWKENDNL